MVRTRCIASHRATSVTRLHPGQARSASARATMEFAAPHEKMSAARFGEEQVIRFVLNEIETVPHLEALLLLWNNRPDRWSLERLRERLFVNTDALLSIVHDLARRGLIRVEDETRQYWYEPGSAEKDALIQAVDEIYRRDLVRISNLIHSKPPAAVREFARAFKFTKEKQ